jgi:hypothetical protein
MQVGEVGGTSNTQESHEPESNRKHLRKAEPFIRCGTSPPPPITTPDRERRLEGKPEMVLATHRRAQVRDDAGTRAKRT